MKSGLAIVGLRKTSLIRPKCAFPICPESKVASAILRFARFAVSVLRFKSNLLIWIKPSSPIPLLQLYRRPNGKHHFRHELHGFSVF